METKSDQVGFRKSYVPTSNPRSLAPWANKGSHVVLTSPVVLSNTNFRLEYTNFLIVLSSALLGRKKESRAIKTNLI
jgi:hypothetical protein